MKLRKRELKQLIEAFITEEDTGAHIDKEWWKDLITDPEFGNMKFALESNPYPGKGYYSYYAFADADGNSIERYKLPDGAAWYYDAKQPLVEPEIKEDHVKKRVYMYHPENKPKGI